MTTALLESAEEGEWPKKYFHDQIFTKECSGRGDQSQVRPQLVIVSVLATDRAMVPVNKDDTTISLYPRRNEPCREKTNILHMRKQRRRSASR